jgi:FlaA1/EpsC-like NDP-sugar epimerase
MPPIIRNKFSNLGRKTKLLILFFSDILMGFIAWTVFGPPLINAVGTDFEISIWDTVSGQIFQFIFPVSIAIIFMFLLGFYRSLIRFFDSMDSLVTSITGSLIFGFSWAFIFLNQLPISASNIFFVTMMQGFVLSVIFYALIHVTRIVARIILYPETIDENAMPIVIYGAGAAGKELMEAIQIDKSKNLIAFFDESRDLIGRSINSIPIFGSIKKLEDLKKQYKNLEVLLAIPSLDINSRRDLISRLERIRVPVRSVPAFHELIFDERKMSDIQSLSLDDLIPERDFELKPISGATNREFLVSGAGGSIGSEIVRQIIRCNPKRVILLDISEFSLFKIFEELKILIEKNDYQTEIIPYLADIKDSNHISQILSKYQVDTIYHAAAYKHVPLVQETYNISRSVNNNFIGTYKFAHEASKANIKSFVLISTDKAVRPENIMGATKRMAELSIQALDKTNSDTKFSMVRFGNVINSSGSVVPLFIDQIANGGPITLTHRDVERYFMTIPEASNLVIQAGEMSEGGEVFILDMGEQMKVIEIAKRLIHLSGRSVADHSGAEGIEIIEVGLRPGEKMYEELLISGNEEKTDNPRIFKSNEKSLDKDMLEEIIQICSNHIENDNFNELASIMTEHVEGFNYE